MSKSQPTILIADDMHPSLFTMLDEAGVTYHYSPRITRAEIIQQIADFDGLIIRSKTKVDHELIAAARQLRFIGRAGAGLDLIDPEAVQERGIQVFHAGEGNRDAVAEHTVGMLLALLANLAKGDREVRRGIWEREGNRGYELGSLTVGLIGYGNNGRATARRLSGFGCRVLAYDKYLTGYADEFVEEATMPQLFDEADVLSLHIPLSDETRMMVDSAWIDRVRKPFYLLNIARGEIASLTALVDGLKSGKIRGAGLDVLENEKLNQLTPEQQMAFDYLRTADNVLLTPHVAGWTHESYVRINEVLVRQLKEIRQQLSL